MSNNQDIATEINGEYRFMIEFDRGHGTDYKCYDGGTLRLRAYIEQTTGYINRDNVIALGEVQNR